MTDPTTSATRTFSPQDLRELVKGALSRAGIIIGWCDAVDGVCAVIQPHMDALQLEHDMHKPGYICAYYDVSKEWKRRADAAEAALREIAAHHGEFITSEGNFMRNKAAKALSDQRGAG